MGRRPEVPGQPALERLEVRVPAELKATILARGGSAYIRRLVRADHGPVEVDLPVDDRNVPTQPAAPRSPVGVTAFPVTTTDGKRHLHRYERTDPTPVRYVRGTPMYKHRCACGLEQVR